MKKAFVWIALVFALGLSIGFYFNKPREVQAGAAVMHEFTTFIEGAGAVNAPMQVVYTPSDGLIEHMGVEEGQAVDAGAALLQMDDSVLQLQLEEAIFALNLQKKAYREQNDTLSRSEEETVLLTARATGYDLDGFNSALLQQDGTDAGDEQVEIARRKVRQLKEMLSHSTVYSVIDGTVLEVGLREGEQVSAGTKAALVASMDDIDVEAGFADQDASTIEPGMEVELYGGCLGSMTCGGLVDSIKPMALTSQQQAGMTSAAIVKIKPMDCSLFDRLGASVELKIITGRKTVVGVPIEALAQDSSGLYVFVVRRGRAYRIPVEVGVLDESYAEVKNGISQGDLVALNPTELRSGQKVSLS